MDYNKFKQILNKKIFEESKKDLIKKIANSTERYIGLFRPTKPKAKIIKNLTQSNEIKFGDAFEILIEEYLKENDFEILNKKFDFEHDQLNLDQHFKKNDKIFFVEQKIRDDHDSTKKIGQTDNFEKKLNLLLDKNNEKDLIGIIYFIDPDLSKNKNYYQKRLDEMKGKCGVELYLFYGKEFFDFLDLDWSEVLKYLQKWKKELLDIPEINFDKEAEKTFEELKEVEIKDFIKIFKNKNIFNEIILTLFPEKKVLKLLLNYFEEKSNETGYKTLYNLLKEKLEPQIS